MFNQLTRSALTPVVLDLANGLLSADSTDALMEKLDEPDGATAVVEELLDHPQVDELMIRLKKRFGATLTPALRYIGVRANVLQSWEEKWATVTSPR